MTGDLSPSPRLIVRADLGVGVQILHSLKNTASHLPVPEAEGGQGSLTFSSPVAGGQALSYLSGILGS